MDRLPTLIALLALVACDKSEKEPEPASRTNGAKVVAKKTDTAAFCDRKFDANGPNYASLSLAGYVNRNAPQQWLWVNLWATWCKPCIEEMPRLLKWQGKLAATTPFEVQFMSVDESAEDLEAYLELHPEVHTSKPVAKDAQEQAFKAIGLDVGAPIPVHIFVDPAGKVRCVRAGGVREQDYAMVEAVLAGK